MRLASEMKNLSEDILASFKQRIRENEELVIEVQKTLDGFRKDHQEMANILKTNAAALRVKLDKDEKNRLKEADILMKSINEKISEIFTFTHDMLAKSEIERLKEFAILMKSINEEILRIFTYTHDLLAKGEVERLKEFNVVMKGIQNDVKNLKKAVAELLGDFAQDRGEASAAWEKMSDILAQLRKTAVTPLKQVVRKAEKKEVKMEIPVEAVKEIPVEAVKETAVEAVKEIPVEVQPKMKPKTVVPMTLEGKVLDFINKHPKGARISEIEEPLGETRMKLGFIAKNLLNEGKVLKIENIYYPKTRHEG